MLPLSIIDAVNAVPIAANGISDAHQSFRGEYRTLHRITECGCDAHVFTRRLDPRINGEVRHWKICSPSMV
jgi:hypothetical protein